MDLVISVSLVCVECVFMERVCETERDSLLLAWNPCDTDVRPYTLSSYLGTGISCHSEHKVGRKFNLFNKTAHSVNDSQFTMNSVRPPWHCMH